MVSTISEGGSYHLEPLICWDPNIFCLFLSCVFLGLFFSFILFFHLGVFLNLIFLSSFLGVLASRGDASRLLIDETS